MLLVLATPFVVTPDTVFPFVVGKALTARVLIEMAFALWVALAVRTPSYRPVLSRLVIAFAVYVALSLLAGFTGVSLQRSLWSSYERMQGVVDLAHGLAFLLVITSLFRTREDWRYVLNFSLLVGMIIALMGVALLFGGNLPVYAFLEQEGERLSITLGNATYVGAYMLVNALVGAGLLFSSFARAPDREESGGAPPPGRRRRRRDQHRAERPKESPALFWWRLYWGAAVVLSLWMMLASGTRASIVALGVVLAGLAVAYLLWGARRRVKYAAAVILAGVVLFGLLVVWGAGTPPGQLLAERNLTMQRLTQTAAEGDDSARTRLSAAYVGLEAFADRPLLGWGPGNYVVAYGRHYDPDLLGSSPTVELVDLAHVAPVDELATKGVIGFAGYLAMWLLLLWAVVSRLRRLGADADILALFVGAALAAYFVHNLALFDTVPTFLQFVLLLGFVATLDAERGEAAGSGRAGVRVPTRLRLPLPAMRAAWRPYAGWAAAALLVAALGTTIYLGNVRAYQAATEFGLAHFASDADWPARLRHHERTITLFPPLANQAHEALLSNMAGDWEALSRDGETLAAAMRLAERAAEELIASEPEYWNGYVFLAQFLPEGGIPGPRPAGRGRGLRANRRAPGAGPPPGDHPENAPVSGGGGS